jgi:hypothetical protein
MAPGAAHDLVQQSSRGVPDKVDVGDLMIGRHLGRYTRMRHHNDMRAIVEEAVRIGGSTDRETGSIAVPIGFLAPSALARQARRSKHRGRSNMGNAVLQRWVMEQEAAGWAAAGRYRR